MTLPDLKTSGIAFKNKELELSVIDFERYHPSAGHVMLDVKYAGVCRTDVDYAHGIKPVELAPHTPTVEYPLVCGHEVAGVVTWCGNDVEKFKVGDHIGIGALVDSCLACENCDKGEEHLCKAKPTRTVGDHGRHGRAGPSTEQTKGGFSTKVCLFEHFGVKLPSDMPLDRAVPLMCAGITMYDPLVTHGAGPGKHIGIAGIGGLGHIGIKLAKAMGCEVTAICTVQHQDTHSISEIGADHVLHSKDKEAMAKMAGKLDLILNTVPVPSEISDFEKLLNDDGTLVQLGFTQEKKAIAEPPLTDRRTQIVGSVGGGMKRMQQMIKFCTEHNILPDVEVVSCDQLPQVFKELCGEQPEPKRYVADMSTIDKLRA